MKILENQKLKEEDVKNEKVLAIDFDGTITAESLYPEIGAIAEGAAEYINKLYDLGYYIIIWTCRYVPDDTEAMIIFLRENGIKYHNINDNKEDLQFKPFPKVFANYYIDDRSVPKFPGWKKAYEIITGDVNEVLP